jgi:hypothetical protein
MALQIDNFSYRGLVIPSAYVRVSEVRGSKRDGWVGKMRIYASADIASEPTGMQFLVETDIPPRTKRVPVQTTPTIAPAPASTLPPTLAEVTQVGTPAPAAPQMIPVHAPEDFDPNPYTVLYARLKEFFPTGVDC